MSQGAGGVDSAYAARLYSGALMPRHTRVVFYSIYSVEEDDLCVDMCGRRAFLAGLFCSFLSYPIHHMCGYNFIAKRKRLILGP